MFSREISILRRSLVAVIAGWFLVLGWSTTAADRPGARRIPNIVLILCDDLGWGDLGCFGAKNIRTPHLDQMAREGTRFTSFYVSQPVCSASRASLLTGCYANRVGISGALFPDSKLALNPADATLAEILKTKGYATACFGKWHLGRPAKYLPTHRGFDEYLGLPYSNDMWPNNPAAQSGQYPPLPLLEGEQVVEEQPDQTQLTRRYTERAIQFLVRNRDRPVFLYLSHSMPHVPLFSGAAFLGKSRGGCVRRRHRRTRLVRRTGARHAASPAIGSKYIGHFYQRQRSMAALRQPCGFNRAISRCQGQCFEGGVRVPLLVRWPGQVPRDRTSAEPLMSIDVLPTVARLTGARLPERPIDGRDV